MYPSFYLIVWNTRQGYLVLFGEVPFLLPRCGIYLVLLLSTINWKKEGKVQL